MQWHICKEFTLADMNNHSHTHIYTCIWVSQFHVSFYLIDFVFVWASIVYNVAVL